MGAPLFCKAEIDRKFKIRKNGINLETRDAREEQQDDKDQESSASYKFFATPLSMWDKRQSAFDTSFW